MSERRACRVIGAIGRACATGPRGTMTASFGEAARAGHQRRRFGYRRLHILLRREGVMINRKKTQRLYREEG
jgi:putative transposase